MDGMEMDHLRGNDGVSMVFVFQRKCSGRSELKETLPEPKHWLKLLGQARLEKASIVSSILLKKREKRCSRNLETRADTLLLKFESFLVSLFEMVFFDSSSLDGAPSK